MIVRHTTHSTNRTNERLKISPEEIVAMLGRGEYIESPVNPEDKWVYSNCYIFSKPDNSCVKIIIGFEGKILTVYKDYDVKEFWYRSNTYGRLSEYEDTGYIAQHYIFEKDGSKRYIEGAVIYSKYISSNHLEIMNSKAVTIKDMEIARKKVGKHGKLTGVGVKTIGGRHTVYLTNEKKFKDIVQSRDKND